MSVQFAAGRLGRVATLVFTLVVCSVAGAWAQTPVAGPWVSQDIGAPAVAGDATGTQTSFTITAGGEDIWGTSDQFHFVYTPVSGDVDVRARVDSITNADRWSKAGVMIRGSLTASAPHALALVSVAKGMAFQRRRSAGADSLHTAGPFASSPAWVRLVRSGTKVTAYSSSDGTNWKTMGSDTIQLGSTAYVGIAVTSHNPGAATTARVSQVSYSQGSGTGGGLPAGQDDADIGAPALAGGASYSSGTYTITAAGNDIWDAADQFHYVYQQVSGDVDVSVRVASVSAADRWSKAGVMIRETLAAGSKHAFALVSSGKGYAFQRRATTNGQSDNTAGSTGTAPGWLRVKRSGDMFTAYQSSDGQNWTVIGSDSIAMSDSVYVGIAATSHIATATTTVVADHFSVDSNTGTTNQPPTVTITSPANGATFSAPANVSLAASASDPEGKLAKVEFYRGNTLLKSDVTTPYSYPLQNLAAGTYTLTAKAYDTSGASATAQVTITVGTTTTNKPPVVSLTSPSNGTTYTAPAIITLTASASDPEGQLSKVEFYRGSTLLGTDTSAPYSFTWSSVAAGSYTFTAKAYDAKGATATSSSVSVTVGNATTVPTGVAFQKSPDDATLVKSYRLEVFAATANVNTATPLATFDAGKPAADSSGTITVSAPSFFSGLSAGSYQLVVAAVGDGGLGLSTPVTFAR